MSNPGSRATSARPPGSRRTVHQAAGRRATGRHPAIAELAVAASGYPGCRPYAEAIASGEADINQCPPGGETTIQALAELLGVDPKPLNAEHGEHKEKHVAIIDEQVCIGCTLCIQACPVDAILGAAKQMHTVVEAECTGCELCIPPCPVDCISMVVLKQDIRDWKWPYPEDERRPIAASAD